MKKTIKFVGISLCGLALLAGCKTKTTDEISANISDGSENVLEGLKSNVKNLTLQDIYDTLKNNSANESVANKLIEIVADQVLNNDTWKARYNKKVEEKLLELAKNDSYKDSNGVFSEELLVKTLKSQLYNVTCEVDKYGPTYTDSTNTVIDKYMQCDYTDYANKALKVEVLSELLKEKYVYDKVLKEKPTMIDTKKTRIVEYITLDGSNEDAFEFITEAVQKLKAENSTETLETIKDAWVEKLIKEVEAKYNKINTIDDKDGAILKEFTNEFNYSKEEGLRLKKKAIYDETYYTKQTINNDNKDILNTTLVERILSDNVLEANAKKTLEINGKYYVVSPLAGSNIEERDIRITDTTSSTKKYYLICVETMPKYSELSDEEKETNEKIYEAVKLLATNTTLVSDSTKYYLEQYKNVISAHDEKIYNYLKEQYSNIFVD